VTATVTSTLLGVRAVPFANGVIRGIAFAPIVRADLVNAKRIRSIMADDMRERLAASGSVDNDALLLAGWTQAQINTHATAAIALARQRAGSDA
jgi:hypothetical protein